MNFIKAARAFLEVFLGEGQCEHPRVNLIEAPLYCTDCGYLVKIEWLFVHCRGCNAKRIPRRSFLGQITPLQQFCRHCGTDGYKLVKKNRIEAYELMYAVSIKSTDYSEKPSMEPAVRSPFKTTVTVESGDIFEAEVIRKSEFKGTKSAFGTSPFDWQQKMDPNRYGGNWEPESPSTNIVPMRKLS